jgi:hypothetical protein
MAYKTRKKPEHNLQNQGHTKVNPWWTLWIISYEHIIRHSIGKGQSETENKITIVSRKKQRFFHISSFTKKRFSSYIYFIYQKIALFTKPFQFKSKVQSSNQIVMNLREWTASYNYTLAIPNYKQKLVYLVKILNQMHQLLLIHFWL